MEPTLKGNLLNQVQQPDDFLIPVRTGISAAYWYNPKAPGFYAAAKLETMTLAATEQTAWFDELFEGALKIPKVDADAPLTILLTGAPGTGKSTLACEICYRLADPKHAPSQAPLRSIYLTTEGHAPWTIKHAEAFGWKDVFGERKDSPVQVLALKSPVDMKNFMDEIDATDPAVTVSPKGAEDSNQLDRAVFQKFFKSVGFWSGAMNAVLQRQKGQTQTSNVLPRISPVASALPSSNRRDIVVFDNLNSISPDAETWFPLVEELLKKGLRLFVIISNNYRWKRLQC